MEAISDAARGPLAPERLGEVLRMAAEVADTDLDHDLLTALDVLNKTRLRPAGQTPLYESELRQIARALMAVIPDDELVGTGGGEVAEVSAWLVQEARHRRRVGAGTSVLAELFSRAAAAHLRQAWLETDREADGDSIGQRDRLHAPDSTEGGAGSGRDQ